MLPGIVDIHQRLCDFEKQYYMVFNRDSAVVSQDNDGTVYHLLAREWVTAEISPGRHIISALALSTDSGVEVFPLVLVTNAVGNGYASADLVDINGQVLSSSPAFPRGPKVLPPQPEGMLVEPSISNLHVTKLGPGHYRATGSVDASVNFFSWDVADFTIDIKF